MGIPMLPAKCAGRMGEQMIKSMTGFGRCEICEDNRKFTVEMKSVNHRYLDVILADETANPTFVASDLLSQAEHGADSQAILITTSETLIDKVAEEVDRQLSELPRKSLAEKSLQSSKLILVRNMQEAIDMINEYAPEHLIIETKDYTDIAEKITNAGSVFLGSYSPESAGDYASGTNHTLPTNGYAKAYSGVSLDSFIRKITFQEITREGIATIGPAIQVMAANEHLDAHKNAITVRLNEKL